MQALTVISYIVVYVSLWFIIASDVENQTGVAAIGVFWGIAGMVHGLANLLKIKSLTRESIAFRELTEAIGKARGNETTN